MKLIRFSAFSTTLLSLATTIAMAIPGRVALAGPLERAACESDRTESQYELQKDERNWRKDQKAKQDVLGQLQSGGTVDIDGRPELNAFCDCRPSVVAGCSSEFWRDLMHSSGGDLQALDSDVSHGCMRIYLQFSSAMQASVPGPCYAMLKGIVGDPTHLGCGLIHRSLLTKQLIKQTADLQNHLDADVPERRHTIAETYHQCMRDADGLSLQPGTDKSLTGSSPDSASAKAKVMPSETKDDDGDDAPQAAPAAAIARPPR